MSSVAVKDSNNVVHNMAAHDNGDGTETQEVNIRSADFFRVGFAEVGSGLVGKAAENLTIKKIGTGMAVNQAGGNLVVTTGVTINSEMVIMSNNPVKGSMSARAKVTLSQRIANNTFRLSMADLIGENLAYTINSATSITVTVPNNQFTAQNVGQSMRISCLSSVGIPGRYVIASVTGDNITFTVSGFPTSGSGTLMLYGWNWIALEYSGTVGTTAYYDAQRRGWASGNTAITTNTTASPGHVAQLAHDVNTAGIADSLVASNAGYQWTSRASRVENLPDPDVEMYLFIVAQNGTVAPATTTTLTIGFIQIEDLGRIKVRIASSDPTSSHALPVQVLNPTSNTITLGNITSSGITAYTDSATNLALNATFTGTARDAGATIGYNLFVASVYADQAGTLKIQKSTDNVTWRDAQSIAVGAGECKELIVRVTARYHRVVYVNGGVAQTAFLLTSALQRF